MDAYTKQSTKREKTAPNAAWLKSYLTSAIGSIVQKLKYVLDFLIRGVSNAARMCEGNGDIEQKGLMNIVRNNI